MKKTYLLFALLIAMMSPVITRASHAQGADLSYQFAYYDASTGVTKYFVTATFYRDCSGIPAPTTMPLNITNSACSGGIYIGSANLPLINGLACPYGGVSGANGCEVSHLCTNALALSTCNSANQYPGMQKYVYADTVALPGSATAAYLCSQWILSIDISARNPSSNLSTTGDLYIEAVINNTLNPNTGQPYQNSSPVFQNDPVPFVCLNTSAPLTYNNATAEPDGDSLVYSLVTPLQAHNTPLVFTAGYTVSCPIKSTIPCSFDSATGLLTYNPLQTDVDVLAYLVQEYRHGVLVGSTMRDVEIKILNCAESVPVIGNPVVVQGGVVVDTTLITACPGDDLIVDVPASSGNFASINLQSSIDQFPQSYSGMTFTQNGTGAAVTGRIEWQSVDTLCRYVYVKAISGDCPVASVIYRVVKICGAKRVTISPASATYCGRPITLTASGGANPIWTPVAGLSSANALITQAAPSVSTWYHLTTGCSNDSVFVKVAPTITSTITHDTTVCSGVAVQLQKTLIPVGTYTYTWTPATGLSDASIANPVFRNYAGALYHCVATDTSGCVLDDSVRVAVRSNNILALTADTLVPTGTQATLTATLSSYAAVSTTIPDSLVTQLSTVQVGTDTLLQLGAAFSYPSPFGNYYKSARHQMLFKASELTALFGGSRIISSFALNIGTLNNGSTLSNFTVEIGSVHADSLTGYIGGNTLQQVWSANYTAVSGWNTFIFQNAYIWDGVSDLVVDVCFANTTSLNLNNKMRYTVTPFRSIWFTYTNGYSTCGVTGSQAIAPTYATFFQRPDAKFGLATMTVSNPVNIQWQPSSGPNAVSNPTALTTSATVNTNQWYTATIADSVCPQANSVLVRVITSGTHTPQSSTICLGDSVLLIAHNASTYSWSDATGVLSTSSSFYYTPNQTSDVVLVMVSSSGTYTDTSHITVLGQRVWPGDADDNNVVDNNDILYLGIAYGDTGAVRANASLSWTEQCTTDWDSTFVNGTNYAHADCNGDGTITYDDTLAIYNNWGLTHAKTNAARQSNYNISITTDKVFYNRNDTIKATLWAGDNNTPIQNIYGLAYQFRYVSAGSAHIVSVDQSVSWLDRKLDFRKVSAAATAYIAQSRINHKDTSGYGKIAEIKLVVDNAASLSDSAYLSVSDILGLNRKGDTVYINAASKTVTVSSAALGVSAVRDEHSIEIYPNPNNGAFRIIQGEAERTAMTMVDAIGREVYVRVLTEKVTNVDLGALPEGIYIASFSSVSGRSSKRVVITR